MKRLAFGVATFITSMFGFYLGGVDFYHTNANLGFSFFMSITVAGIIALASEEF